MSSSLDAYDRLRTALVDARHSANLTQLDVASQLSRPQSFVSKYEQGERRLDVVEFLAVCRVLKADPHEILRAIHDY
jgi:transcriptional regulator with XRE-family HTH domain